MKRNKIAGILLLVFVPVFLFVGIASAQSFRSGNQATVPEGETVDSTVYAAGNNVDVAGTVNGDVICAGQNVSISGTVNGDVICAGQTVHVSGPVSGDVRLAGQTITIGSEVKGSASVAAQSFTLEGSGRIGRDLSTSATNTNLHGPVGRDAAVMSSTTIIANTVGRDVNANVDRLSFRDQASVGGNLEYTSPNNAEIQEGTRIAGKTTRHQPQTKQEDYGVVLGWGLGFGAYMIISLLLLSVALVLLFPGIFNEASAIALRDPFKTFLIGLLATIVVPVVIGALALTVIGIPLALLLLLIWILVLILAGPMFSYFLGRLILRDNHPVLMMAVGSLIVLLSYMIPILGVIMLFAVIWLGVGMFLREAMRRTPRPSYATAKTAPAPTRSSRKNK